MLAVVAGLGVCIVMTFGVAGLAKAWPPVGLFLATVAALAVYFGRRASDMRRENVEAMLNMLQLARAEAEAANHAKSASSPRPAMRSARR